MGDRRPPTRPGRPSARAGARATGHGHQVRDLDERTDVVQEVASGDVSSIEADEAGPAPAEASFEVPPRAAVFIAPPAGLASAAFGAPRSTTAGVDGSSGPSTDSMPAAERPIEVRKWRSGGDGAAAPQRIRTSVVPLPQTDHDATPPLLDTGRGADATELLLVLADVERRLASLETVLGDRPGQPAKAQLAAARRRLAEALAMLHRS